MQGFSFQTAPPELRSFLSQLVDDTRALLANELVAAILHGSLAMGSFYPPKSDIDLLVVVSDLDVQASEALYDLFERYEARRPYVAGLEMSGIRARDAEHPCHPLPYLVHFPCGPRGREPRTDGAPLPTDQDLIAHLMVSKQRGLSLFGPPPAELVGPIAWNDYLAAVKYDIDELLSGDVILQSPRYAVLNLCRWVMMRFTLDHLVPSKEEAARWALEHLPPEHRAIVARALEVYRSDEPVRPEDLISAGGPWDARALVAFRDWIAEDQKSWR